MTSAGSLRTPLEAELVGRLLERRPTSARLPVGALNREEKAAELQHLQARKAMDAAYEAELGMRWPTTLPTPSTRRRATPARGGGRGLRMPSCPG